MELGAIFFIEFLGSPSLSSLLGSASQEGPVTWRPLELCLKRLAVAIAQAAAANDFFPTDGSMGGWEG